jgi:hypothetical protein
MPPKKRHIVTTVPAQPIRRDSGRHTAVTPSHRRHAGCRLFLAQAAHGRPRHDHGAVTAATGEPRGSVGPGRALDLQ